MLVAINNFLINRSSERAKDCLYVSYIYNESTIFHKIVTSKFLYFSNVNLQFPIYLFIYS